MADETIDDELRAIAEHRGFKLLKSRRRKPGVADFGKFGLTDAAGKPLLGIGTGELTASAIEIEDFLRTGALSNWKQSAERTPDRPKPARSADAEKDEAPPEKVAGSREEKGRRAALTGRRKARSATTQSEATDRKSQRPKPVAKPEVVPDAPSPTLEIRPVKRGEIASLATFLGETEVAQDRDALLANLSALLRAGGGLLAELDKPVGCCLWALVPTAQRGLVGRLTMLIVDTDYRRQGIGSKLLETAAQTLARKGCVQIEAMSDIEIKNAHNFFRTLGFDQTSYRFARKTDAP